GDEVVDARVTPELDLFRGEARRGDGVVERDRVAAVEPRDKRRLPPERWHRLRKPEVANRGEIARSLVRQHQRHAIDDERLDVAQPISNDRRREGQRDDAERNGRELQRQRWIGSERPGQRVTKREGTNAKRGAPRDPAQLPPRCARRDLPERTRENGDRGDTA